VASASASAGPGGFLGVHEQAGLADGAVSQQLLVQRGARSSPSPPPATFQTSGLAMRREKALRARSRREMLFEAGAAAAWLENPLPAWLRSVAQAELRKDLTNSTQRELPVPLLIETRA
jgi:hypothetical protein